jgi:hydroxymethylbilane synthase
MSDTPSPIVLVGTRGSDLALVQATATEQALATAFPELRIERRVIVTTGDRRTDVSLSEVAKAEGIFDKGVFIKELEDALDRGEVSLAVHSLKDMPTVLDARFELAAVLERAPVRDVLVSRRPGGLAALSTGARVATGSVRRARQIEWLRPDLHLLDLRGNVPTRLRKLAEEGDYDAILLAEAGLVRLGFLPETAPAGDSEPLARIAGLWACRFDPAEFLPAAGQGAIGLEVRSDDPQARAWAQAIGHRETWQCVTAEREFLRLLEGGCHTPVGVFSTLDNGRLRLEARVFPETGGTPRHGSAEGPGDDPLGVGRELFNSLS